MHNFKWDPNTIPKFRKKMLIWRKLQAEEETDGSTDPILYGPSGYYRETNIKREKYGIQNFVYTKIFSKLLV